MRGTRFLLAVHVLGACVVASGAPAFGQDQHKAPQKHGFVPARPGMGRTMATDEPDTVPHTLAEALGLAYETNPQLTGERAHLRATDENVPTALAGWRPTVVVQGSYGYAVGRYESLSPCSYEVSPNVNFNTNPAKVVSPGIPHDGCVPTSKVSSSNPFPGFGSQSYTVAELNNRTPKTLQGTVTQYLYRGGHTTASTHEAVNSVYAERARLIAEEEQVFSDTITAYVTYIEDAQLLQLDRANEQVLGDELRAIESRFKVGELTRTDVAQAEAALAAAIATRQTAEGTLETARATFVREVGVPPPADLADPQPLKLPVKDEADAVAQSVTNNPNVIAAKFNESQMRDAVDVAFSQLGPQLFLQGQGFDLEGQSLTRQRTYGATATLNLTLPIYQGGQEYAAIRAARQSYLQAVRQTEDAQRAAKEQAVQAYETLVAAKASIDSSKVGVRSSEIALEGLEREALVGSATTQEVLIGQQNLLSAEITLVQNVTSLVTASYGVASAIGRLTAADLGLAVPRYDETAYYKAVRGLLWGTGDRAVDQPGR
jgi:outer membrane protein